MSDAVAIAAATRVALARPCDRPLAEALPSRMELALVVGSDSRLEAMLPVLIEALAPLGIASTHLEVILGCAEDGSARDDARDRLRRTLDGVRVHAHDARRGDTYPAARLDAAEVRLDDALRECEGMVLVLAARPGSAGVVLAGELVAALADADTRSRIGAASRPLADALVIDLALVLEVSEPARVWAGTGRWLLATRFPLGSR